jgi:ribonuclease III
MTSTSIGLRDLESRFSYPFKNTQLLEQAVTHRSFFFENREKSPGHNERLEFLGDAVIDLAISDELMRLFPEESEGVLSKWRASLVNETSLAEISQTLNLGQYLKLGRGELLAQAGLRPRLLASAFEAVVGALYQDGGWQVAKDFLISTFAPGIQQVSSTSDFEADYKTRLQEKVQKVTHAPPDYRITKTEGPDHNKIFFVEVSVQGETLATGSGSSRKQAEQQAAKLALTVSETKKDEK